MWETFTWTRQIEARQTKGNDRPVSRDEKGKMGHKKGRRALAAESRITAR